VNGQVQTFDLSCDALSVLHQETYSADSYSSNLHEVLYALDCSRGADAERFGGKVIVSAMATFGNPGEFTVEQPKGTFTTVRYGTSQPLNSPAGGGERGRVIPTADSVYAAVLVPVGQTSDFATGLTETWYSGLALRRTDGTELVFVDPSYAVASASRYFNVATLNAEARTVELCYLGISLAGELIDDPLRAALIVRQARGPECSGIAPNGPATPRVSRIPTRGASLTDAAGMSRWEQRASPTAAGRPRGTATPMAAPRGPGASPGASSNTSGSSTTAPRATSIASPLVLTLIPACRAAIFTRRISVRRSRTRPCGSHVRSRRK
jgi:hypothetical protein